MVQCSAKGVDVGTGVRVACVAAVLFEGRVLHRTPALHYRNRPLVVGSQELDESKVHELDVARRCDLDIAGLDVAVKNRWILGVHVV
jgi:hypothetical protein